MNEEFTYRGTKYSISVYSGSTIRTAAKLPQPPATYAYTITVEGQELVASASVFPSAAAAIQQAKQMLIHLYQ